MVTKVQLISEVREQTFWLGKEGANRFAAVYNTTFISGRECCGVRGRFLIYSSREAHKNLSALSRSAFWSLCNITHGTSRKNISIKDFYRYHTQIFKLALHWFESIAPRKWSSHGTTWFKQGPDVPRLGEHSGSPQQNSLDILHARRQ